MKPTWDKLAEKVSDTVFIADVNCSDEPKLCNYAKVKSYPTIHAFIDGQKFVYEGGRSYEELYDYVDEHLAIHCLVDKPSECDAKSQTFLKKWKAKPVKDVALELDRLDGLVQRQMTHELKRWMKDRMQILDQLLPEDE